MKKILALVYIISFTFTAFSQVDLKHGLMAYYPFNGNDKDASGHNNHPVFNNAKLTADRQGNPNSAYHFNGKNNYMLVRNHPSLNMSDKISIALWVKPTGYYRGKCYNNMLVAKGDDDYLEGNYSLRFSDAYTGCTDPDASKEMFYGVGGAVAKTPLVQLGRWYSVVWTCDGSTIKIYVDCILRASSPAGSNRFTNSYDLYFGHMNHLQYPYWLDGDLDEVSIYNRALTAKEVTAYCEKKPIPIPEPAIDFTYTITSCNTVNFSISKSENIKRFRWYLGDGKTATLKTISNLYQNEGTYTAKLVATGTNGKEITTTKSFTIKKPTADFSIVQTTGNNIIQFDIEHKQPVKYSWNFGDGTVSAKEKNINHAYKVPGRYAILLVAENKEGCRDTAQQFITIPSLPVKDSLPITVIPNIPISNAVVPVLEPRKNNLLKEITVTSDSVEVSFYDNATIDGDSVTIVYNDKIIVTHLFLTDKPGTFMLAVDKTIPQNELIMYAENLGSIPPNTALMVIYDGEKRYEVNISSSKESNGMVTFKFMK